MAQGHVPLRARSKITWQFFPLSIRSGADQCSFQNSRKLLKIREAPGRLFSLFVVTRRVMGDSIPNAQFPSEEEPQHVWERSLSDEN